MAKILCITTGLTGILNASFELMNRLEALGHEVICASPAQVGARVKLQGFTYLQLEPIQFDPAPELPSFSGGLRKSKRLVYKFVHVKKRRQEAIDNLGMNRFLQIVNGEQPDLVIVDIELHELIMTTFKSNYPLLLLTQWFSTWDSKGLPPIQSTIIPGEGFNGSSLGLQLSWIKVRYTRWKMFLKKKINSIYTDRRSILQAYAKQIAFPKKYIKKNYWPGPFSYDHLPVISMTARELEFPHQPRLQLTYLGPMVFADRRDLELAPEKNEKLTAIFNLKKATNKRLIYCSVSTFREGDTEFLKRVVKAVDGVSDCLLIISLGGMLKSDAFRQLPENVFAFDRVPQIKVLAQADLSINHGGIHTINECIHFNVPMLVYSGKRSDQNGCAARVHYHGIGLMADKDLNSSDAIRKKIFKVLDDSGISTRLSILQKKYSSQNNQLEKLLVEFGIESKSKPHLTTS
jgi:UDP:flavonoid glycosyltransferase YjiC (YdhE family)